MNDQKKEITYRKKLFHEVVGKELKRRGFKRRESIYYKVIDGDILQIAGYGCGSERSYSLGYDILPLYASHFMLNVECGNRLKDFAGINFTTRKTMAFEEEVKQFCDMLFPIFESVIDSESLMKYCKKHKGLIESHIYVDIRCGNFSSAISKISSFYKDRMEFEKEKYENGVYNDIEYKESIEFWNDMYSQKLELMGAMKSKNQQKVDFILNSNRAYNKNILEERYKFDLQQVKLEA